MNILKGAVVAAVFVLLAAGAEAQTAPSSTPSANPAPAPAPSPTSSARADTAAKPTKAKADPDDRVICKDEEETGSRLGGHRVCHSKRKWDQMARDAGDLVNGATMARDPGRPQ